MAAPIASNLQLPDDTPNAGKRFRTQIKSIGGVAVHEQFIVPSFGFTIAGKYFFSSTQLSVSATIQDGLTTGFFWIQNPLASTITAMIRSIHATATTSSTVVAPTAPVISFNKFTFTGNASGAAVTPVPYQTAGTANQLIIRTASTGMTPALVGDVGQFYIPSVLTGVGAVYATKDVLPRNPVAYFRGNDLELAPGEGLVVYQSVAGTGSDPRKFGIQAEWLELDTA